MRIVLFLLFAFPLCAAAQPTHFWKIVKENNIWWFRSPEGKNEFISAVTTVQPFQQAISGPGYVASDFAGDNLDGWARRRAEKIPEYGFKAAGAWSNKAIFPYISHTRDLNLLLWTTVPISSPLWEKQVEDAVTKQVNPSDRNLIGYYLDNEINWQFHEQDAEKYFEVTSRLVRKYDPNHAILGVRFNRRPPKSVLVASIGRVDAHSVNVYSDAAMAWKQMFREIYNLTKVPIIVSEFSFYAQDNWSGNTNAKGFGGRRKSQDDRAFAYEFFVTGMEKTSFIIGCEWFQLNDEPPGGRLKDGEDLNVGVVNIEDKPYPIVKTIKRVTEKANEVHSTSDDSMSHPVWWEQN
jgi:hypothetical protein